jgi:hypothetical protein
LQLGVLETYICSVNLKTKDMKAIDVYSFAKKNNMELELLKKAANIVARKNGYHHATHLSKDNKVIYKTWGVRTNSNKFFPKIRSISKVPYRNKKGELLWWYESMECCVPMYDTMNVYNALKSK